MRESCYLRGVRGLAPAWSAASRMHSRTGGAHTGRYIHKAVHTKGVFVVSREPEEVSRGTPRPPGGGRKQGGGRRKALMGHIYIYIYIYRAGRLLYSRCSTSNGCVSASDAGKTSSTVSARRHALFVIFSRTSFTWVTYTTPRSPIKKLRILLQMALGMGSRNACTCLAPTNRQTCGGAQVHLHGPGQGSGEDSGKQQT